MAVFTDDTACHFDGEVAISLEDGQEFEPVVYFQTDPFWKLACEYSIKVAACNC